MLAISIKQRGARAQGSGRAGWVAKDRGVLPGEAKRGGCRKVTLKAHVLYQFQIRTALVFEEPLAAKPPCPLRNLRFRAAAHAPAVFEFQHCKFAIRIREALLFSCSGILTPLVQDKMSGYKGLGWYKKARCLEAAHKSAFLRICTWFFQKTTLLCGALALCCRYP